MKKYSLLTLTLFLVTLSNTLLAKSLVSYYLETNSNKTPVPIQWHWPDASTNNNLVRVLISEEQHSFNVSSDPIGTLLWKVEEASQKTNLVGKVEGSTLTVKGTDHGQSIFVECDTKGNPWFQALQWNLSTFIKQKRDSMKFIVVRTDDYSCHQLVAYDKGLEKVEFLDGQLAHKIRVTLPGIKNIFWSAYYWFTPQTLEFLRYEAVQGFMESKTIIKKINAENESG